MTEKRPGPAPGVRLTEVSVKRELTVFDFKGKRMLSTWLLPCFLCRIEVDEEIRKQVDELMRQELKNLKMVCIVHRSMYLL